MRRNTTDDLLLGSEQTIQKWKQKFVTFFSCYICTLSVQLC